jgi:hypothetical protein
VKASLGAFLVGSLCGAVQAQQPWRGYGILANIGIMVGWTCDDSDLDRDPVIDGCTTADSGIDLAGSSSAMVRGG